ncbi:MAG: reverse transcriptase-like protein [Pseudomonadota bacterium]|nr:reverse transcriptase-like protein [Pseudomonadota bacterium]
MTKHRLKVYFDGGCRPNPGRIEVAVVARGKAYLFDDLGQGSNTSAEWLALIKALEVAQGLGEADFMLLGDARVVIDQANGLNKCRSQPLQAHQARFVALVQVAAPARIRWIARAQNLAGIALAARHGR